MTPLITVDRNYVILEDTKIIRPSSMSPTQWLEYWEKNPADVDALEAKVEDLEAEVKEVEARNDDLIDERDEALAKVKRLEARLDVDELS